MKKIFVLIPFALVAAGFAQDNVDEYEDFQPEDNGVPMETSSAESSTEVSSSDAYGASASTGVRQAPAENSDLPKEKRPTYNFKSYGLGVSVWHNWEDSKINPKRDWTQGFVLHYGRIWEMTHNGAITLMDNTQFSWGDGDFQWSEVARIGGRYYFNDESISPFLGAGIGLGFQWDTHMSGDDIFAFGLAGGAEVGVTIFKTSKTQLEIGCSYDFVTDYIDFGELFGSFNFYLAVNY
ncbi:hypothetical protein [Fibrobacter sp. UWEL]|uniref:hypothetical protein n=1 Tax=Fibrobacter sp. UWEL TaxID=1896209 RepID=UPI00090F99E2|nr:hypothetical protein [Fibrobacter sp. UWEL]SHL17079.1 hypothetical protein SAMN05720468_11573 [Fibrobacter sp. UWEL]